jgi:xanthine dehydrogenase accessory factor
MREIIAHIDALRTAGARIATARVVGVEGSGPRELGATLVVTDSGEVFGSVSGGCVEAAVVGECRKVLDGAESNVVTYGISDDEAFTVGLTCGGTIHILVERLDDWISQYESLREALTAQKQFALVSVLDGLDRPGSRLAIRPGAPQIGTLGKPRLDSVVERDSLGQLASGETTIRHYGIHGEARRNDITLLIECFGPPPRMIIFGAVDFTAALARVAKTLGYRVTVCDARSIFATHKRFPDADEVVVDWPDRYLEQVGSQLTPRDAVCVLTHDHKFDVPALVSALETAAGYVGAMGSRRTTVERSARLRAVGLDEADLARIKAPLGLDIGARTPEETAISICAEIIATQTEHRGGALASRDGPIHAQRPHLALRTALIR